MALFPRTRDSFHKTTLAPGSGCASAQPPWRLQSPLRSRPGTLLASARRLSEQRPASPPLQTGTTPAPPPPSPSPDARGPAPLGWGPEQRDQRTRPPRPWPP